MGQEPWEGGFLLGAGQCHGPGGVCVSCSLGFSLKLNIQEGAAGREQVEAPGQPWASTDRDPWGRTVRTWGCILCARARGEPLLFPSAQKELLHPTELLSASLNNPEAETETENKLLKCFFYFPGPK